MIEIFRNPSYNFIGRRKIAYAVSLLAIGIDLALALAQRTLVSPGLARPELQRPAGGVMTTAETP